MELVIEKQKILEYLLKPIEKADKSKFLNLIGYNIENWSKLKDDIIEQFSNYQVVTYDKNEYGVLYRIDGKLVAPLKTIDLTTIRIGMNENLKLVTLFPKK